MRDNIVITKKWHLSSLSGFPLSSLRNLSNSAQRCLNIFRFSMRNGGKKSA